MDRIIKDSLARAISYEEYSWLIQHCASLGKTTGHEQTELQVMFTRLNASRMRRLDKTIQISEVQERALCENKQAMQWLVIMETWCADGAQTLPVLQKICNVLPEVTLWIVLRDEHPELMDLFLTHGTRSIPKLIALDEDGALLFTWGPRSKEASSLVSDYKAIHGKVDDTCKKELQQWYNKNAGKAITDEIIGKLSQRNKKLMV